MSSEPAKVCVIGSINMDLVVRTPRLPVHGETVLGGGYRTFPGGKGANQAVAAARMGAKVSLIGCIGDDPHGPKVRAALDAESMDLAHLAVRAGQSTGLALITVAENGENTIVVSSGANASLTPEDVAAASAAITSADVTLLQLEIPLPAVLAAAQAAKSAGRAVLLNAAPARQLNADLLKLVDVVLVNKVEGARILGLEPNIDPGRLALRLPELGVHTAILTLGQQGAVLVHRGRIRRVPTPGVQPVDATGAGDAFCGVFAAMWPAAHAATARSDAEFAAVERAVLMASAAGALATTKLGAIPSLPTRAEIEPLAADLKLGT